LERETSVCDNYSIKSVIIYRKPGNSSPFGFTVTKLVIGSCLHIERFPGVWYDGNDSYLKIRRKAHRGGNKMENTKADTKITEKAAETATEVILQYREYEVNMEDVTSRVKAHYFAKGFKEDSIESMQIYVKPEDFTAYYVINDGVVGKVSLF